MHKETPSIATVTILDREYRLTCPEDEHAALFSAARLLDERMRHVRETGRVIGLDKIAVLVALHLARDLLQEQTENEAYAGAIQGLREKIDAALLDVPEQRE